MMNVEPETRESYELAIFLRWAAACQSSLDKPEALDQ
jgi:hypothetical protein